MYNAQFEQVTVDRLRQEIDPSRVKVREGSGGRSLSYVEGYDVIDFANEVFGFDGWSMRTTDVRYMPHIGANGGYTATVSVSVGTVEREDAGVGLVAGRDAASPEAHETAIKGAVTDAMKRAFRTFGNAFGNSLYDKENPLHKAAANGSSGASGRSKGSGAKTAAQPKSNGDRPKGWKGSQYAASEPQLRLLRRTAQENDVSPEELDALAQSKFGYGVDQLSKRDASQLIDQLKDGGDTVDVSGFAADDEIPF